MRVRPSQMVDHRLASHGLAKEKLHIKAVDVTPSLHTRHPLELEVGVLGLLGDSALLGHCGAMTLSRSCDAWLRHRGIAK